LHNRDFLKEKALQLGLPADKLNAAILLLEKAKETYRVFYNHEINGEYASLYIYCDTTSFANCYFYLGQLFQESKIFYSP
jgi:hypothetical protein